MSRIAQDVLATLFFSLDDERRALVRRLTRTILELPLSTEEREDYVAGFILHAVEAQARAATWKSPSSAPPRTADNDVATPEPEPIRMATADVVRALVHSTPPSSSKVPKASGQN